MQLQVTIPSQMLLDQPVLKVAAEGPDGCFCLLPHHVDWVTTLVPGIVTITQSNGDELFLATDSGLLVKQGEQVCIAARHAVTASRLEDLAPGFDKLFHQNDSSELRARSLLGRMEMTFLRQFIELQEAP